jgi:hypothetical protein
MQAKFRREFVKQSPGRVLVVGSKLFPTREDWRAWHPDGFGVDMQPGEGVDFVQNLEHSPVYQTFGHIECTSVLEHVERPWLMAANLEKMLEPGGSIFLSVPWVFNFHGYPQDLYRFSHVSFPILFPSIQWRDIRYSCRNGLQEGPRSPKNDGGLLDKMLVMGWGVKE